MITDLRTAEQRIRLPGQISRAAAVFSVDEIVVFDDRPQDTHSGNKLPSQQPDPDAYTGDTDPAHFLSHVLNYLETPPFMRRTLWPIHRNLALAGHLPSLDMPHHPSLRDWVPYREGVSIEGMVKSGGPGTVVDVGLKEPVELEDVEMPPGTRVTLHFPEGENGPVAAVAPDAPRIQEGYYWGYSVRTCKSLSGIFTECPFEDGYDLSIGTSERGLSTGRVWPDHKKILDFKHLIVVFGGPRGLEFAAANDEELVERGISGGRTRDLFDHWVNVLPGQGSRTIRTEEAVFIGLTALRRLWDEN